MDNLPGAGLAGDRLHESRLVSKRLPHTGIRRQFLSKSLPRALAGEPAYLEAACHPPELQVMDVWQLQPKATQGSLDTSSIALREAQLAH